ncbi:transmembrane protein -like [Brachionus plicatilis]|uniref:Transmembrane protein-like n=1 Tax=Brachionus plicatilis TaxID=10195 RepID=A0A3M7SZJ1_BRAPC|nr:transmembrane protein -like [Brachionus plicatilis]
MTLDPDRRCFKWLVLFMLFWSSNGLHLKGTFKTDEFFKFLTRFGIQSTNTIELNSTRGFIYGNIWLVDSVNINKTKPLPRNLQIMLTSMDINYFIDYYEHRRIRPRSDACNLMFENINQKAFFFGCNENGKLDFIRHVPCFRNELCNDEDRKQNVIPGYQFTYKIQDVNQPRFWYLSLVACVRDDCKWKDLGSMIGNEKSVNGGKNPSYTIAYDIWLVNGNPKSDHKSLFGYQFTYELQDVFEIYLCSFLIYFFIFPFIVHRIKNHFHYLYLLLFIYVTIELISRFLSMIHTLVFAFDGNGVYFLLFVGDLMEEIGISILILILISIAKGWTTRSKELKVNKKSIILGTLLQFTLITSHLVSLETTDSIFNKNSYETFAGYVELGTRFLFMVWFLLELKETFRNVDSAILRNELNEDDDNASVLTKNSNEISPTNSDDEYEIVDKTIMTDSLDKSESFFDNTSREEKVEKYMTFYLHYGACCLVWFIYLPVLIFICSFVSELFRFRLILGIRFFVNFLSVVVLFYIMWSPKTPLKLPGKKKEKYEFANLQYIYNNDGMAHDDGQLIMIKENNQAENLINLNGIS